MGYTKFVTIQMQNIKQCFLCYYQQHVGLWKKLYCVTIQMKAIEQYFHVGYVISTR